MDLHLSFKVTSKRESSVTTSSDGLIFVKRRAKDGRFFSKNTGIRRAKRRAKFDEADQGLCVNTGGHQQKGTKCNASLK